ncbi:MAG: hypothetical protein JNJ46_17465 [Myxococcales bacterium]|nr:hypothetical protein [Myxococcales bacterium]
MWTLLTALQLVWAAFLASPSVGSQTGLAAVYGQPGDRLAGGPLACTHQPLRQDELVCAHRTLPCGTQLLVQSRRSGRIATCRVLDRGPYGARLASGRFVIKLRPEERGTWRGIVDLSPAVAHMLGVTGNEPVRMLYLRPGSPIEVPGLPPMPSLPARRSERAAERPSPRSESVVRLRTRGPVA